MVEQEAFLSKSNEPYWDMLYIEKYKDMMKLA